MTTSFIPEAELSEFIINRQALLEKIDDIPEAFIDRHDPKYPCISDPHMVEAFDPNKYFDVFDQIQIKNGYLLDYVYNFDGHGGSPLLYVRKESESPLKSSTEYYQRYSYLKRTMILGQEPVGRDFEPYLPYLKFINSPMGCFQFALFALTAHRFYSCWHACYNDRQFIFNKEELSSYLCKEHVLKLPQCDRDKLALINPTPRVRMTEPWEFSGEQVRLFNYEVNLGFSFLHINIARPNRCGHYRDCFIVKGEHNLYY